MKKKSNNNMNRFILLILLGFNIPFMPATGQLTIGDCQDKAMKNYPLIRQFNLLEQAEAYTLDNAGKGYLPQLTVSVQASLQSDITRIPPELEQILSQLSGQPVEFPSLNKDQYQLLAEVNQTIWDGGAISSQMKMIKASNEVEKYRLETDLYTLRDRTDQLFFGILALHEQLIQIDLLQKELQINYDKVKAYIQNGLARQSDLDAVRVEQLRANQRYADILAAHQSYKLMLSALIGDPASVDDSLVKPDYHLTNFDEMTIRRPEINLFDAQRRFYDSQQYTIKSGKMPKIGVFARGGYGNPGLNMFEPGFTPYYMLGVRINWSLWGLYTEKNNLKALEVKKQQVETQRETFLFNTHLLVIQNNHQINKIQEQLRHDEEIISLRKSIRKTMEVQVANGTHPVTDLISELNAEFLAIQDKKLREIHLLKAIHQLKNTTNN